MKLSGPSRRFAAGFRWCGVAIAVAALLLLHGATASALSIPVTASDGTQVGTITVNVGTTNAPDPPGGLTQGVTGGFTSTYGDPPSLQAAAEKCGEHHFNWFQGVLSDNNPPNGPDGKPLTPPYIDPPTGGYGPPDEQWADSHPWYWDEEVPDPKPPSYDERYQLSENTTTDNLHYEDFPWGGEGTNLKFATWLVSLNEDGSLHSFHGGFKWTWERLSPGQVISLYQVTPGEGLQFYNHHVLGIPEPTSCTLAVLGLVCLVVVGRASRRRAA